MPHRDFHWVTPPMTRNTNQTTSLFALISCALTLTGCTSLNLPTSAFSKPSSPEYQGIDPAFDSIVSSSEQTYHSVRQARAQNAIVLQVEGDSTPIRVLPLPPGQKSVFVSDLLKQTGVQKKLGSLEATLFRFSTDTIGGLPMVVKMSPDGRSVRPVSDYALHAGDRLRVREAANPAMKGLVNMVLGI